MKDRVLRDFSEEDLELITRTYHGWRMNYGTVNVDDDTVAQVDPNEDYLYEDIPGFCKSADFALIKKHDYVLTPGRYVGAAAEEDDGEPFPEKMARLTTQLKSQFEESERLEAEIKKELGWGWGTNSEWQTVRLGDYCSKIGSGATPRGGANVYMDDGEICLIRSQNIYNDGF